ncbi:hypothetical protein KDD93_06870 [Campylobacter sp. faydin G-24]|uniref:Phage neck terminator protein gp12-like domain-containing protein n=1 Tax=Campylobacter anatolicus TaxID=2829105 RepID=A0ABS5HJH2_9BACT|nr:hypothetical protein [Campylobacter anatolicus]MBR8464282.1 hypothetical protein [Campylobacter anatolicus]
MMGLRAMIARALKLPDERVRGEYKNELNDEHPYITLSVLSSTQRGRERKFKDEEEFITSSREAVISINAFGRNAMAVLESLNAIFYTNEALDELKRIKMSLINVGSIKNLTLAIGAGAQERGAFDITVGYIKRIKKEQFGIQTAQIMIKGE